VTKSRRIFNISVALAITLSACSSPRPADPESFFHSHLIRDQGPVSSGPLHDFLQKWGTEERRPNNFQRTASRKKPLRDIRVAIDPGHVGGPPWDELNGKYVFDTKGRRLSEGLLALELALLLEKDLSRLGAKVLLTRRSMEPVTSNGTKSLRELDDVFRQLDLDARAEKIWSFNPDITLILHFDATLPAGSANIDQAKSLCDGIGDNVKAYVPGAFTEKDLHDPLDQAFFRELWQNPLAWRDSVGLSEKVVGEIQGQLGIRPEMAERNNTLKISPGVFARNLRLNRRLAGFVQSYVECLCYEDPTEFEVLSSRDFTIRIGNKDYPYSKRLLVLSKAITDGVLGFIRTKSTNIQ
jgi:N-acetylmuramoyl-L-alanine amidase